MPIQHRSSMLIEHSIKNIILPSRGSRRGRSHRPDEPQPEAQSRSLWLNRKDLIMLCPTVTAAGTAAVAAESSYETDSSGVPLQLFCQKFWSWVRSAAVAGQLRQFNCPIIRWDQYLNMGAEPPPLQLSLSGPLPKPLAKAVARHCLC